MKIVNKEKTIELVEELIKKVNEGKKNTVEMAVNESKEENGSMWFTFSVKTTEKFKAFPVAKVGLYIFESMGRVSTFIINCRTAKLLFENATINSPEIAIHYLESILVREIEWTAGMEKTLKDASIKKASKSKGKSKGYNKSNGKSNYNNSGDKKPKKPQGPGRPSRQFRGNGNSGGRNNSQKRNYSNNSGMNIRTTKQPYKNSNNQ